MTNCFVLRSQVRKVILGCVAFKIKLKDMLDNVKIEILRQQLDEDVGFWESEPFSKQWYANYKKRVAAAPLLSGVKMTTSLGEGRGHVYTDYGKRKVHLLVPCSPVEKELMAMTV